MRNAVFTTVFLFILLMMDADTPLRAQERKKYWVYFNDKGEVTSPTGSLKKFSREYQQAMNNLSSRALQRRAKTLSMESLVSFDDLPVYESYINRVEQIAGRVQQRSRWQNAASFYLTEDQLNSIASFPFVKNVVPVIIVHGKQLLKSKQPPVFRQTTATSLNYGPSYTQVAMIDAVALHQIGITGNGVRIGMLDSGFRWRVHEALQTRKIVGEYDFINHDSVTSNESGDSPSQDTHGTYTLSALGGFYEGKLIGPAFDAEFLLAKTEYIPTELQIEEDNWAAGIEWLEAEGVDVISSSVGYDLFNDGGGYTWDNGDFNGRTSVTARAAIHAARLGVLVCNSMGNEGNGDGIQGTMLTPADADSILSAGATYGDRELAYFSSTGPTNDGRIKPDVVALGAGVYCATPGKQHYGYEQGTSMSAPLVAASAALVFSARPELTAMQVRDAIRQTADTANNSTLHVYPNNFFGWGFVDAFAAALSFGPIFCNEPDITANGSTNIISTIAVSKFGLNPDSVILFYKTENQEGYTELQMMLDSAMFYPGSGKYSIALPPLPSGAVVQFYIEANDSAGNSYRSPAPAYHNDWQFCCGINGVWSGQSLPEQYSLLQNFPNPFNSSTTVSFVVKQCEQVDVSVYALNGQKIKTLMNSVAMPQFHRLQWNGENEQGIQAASGVYFLRLTSPSFSSTRSMLLLR